jgi:hypothetical protein
MRWWRCGQRQARSDAPDESISEPDAGAKADASPNPDSRNGSRQQPMPALESDQLAFHVRVFRIVACEPRLDPKLSALLDLQLAVEVAVVHHPRRALAVRHDRRAEIVDVQSRITSAANAAIALAPTCIDATIQAIGRLLRQLGLPGCLRPQAGAPFGVLDQSQKPPSSGVEWDVRAQTRRRSGQIARAAQTPASSGSPGSIASSRSSSTGRSCMWRGRTS